MLEPLLDYLVTSRTRRKLLDLLWRDGHSSSVRELARIAGVSFASAHKELAEMARASLATSTRIGGARVYSADRSSSAAAAMDALLSAPSGEAAPKQALGDRWSEDAVRHGLAAAGAPLVLADLAGKSGKAEPKRGAKGKSKRQRGAQHGACAPSLEELLAQALRLAHRDATVARVLPLVFYRHRDALDLNRLAHRARQLDETQSLGFFLELTATLGNVEQFAERARRLLDRRVKKMKNFFSRAAPASVTGMATTDAGKFAARLTEQNTPELARRWHFLMNMPMESFASHFERHAHA